MVHCRGLLLVLAAARLLVADAWQEWTWNGEAPLKAPMPRMGHSAVLFRERIIIFGGRSNPRFEEHRPKSFAIAREEGELKFTTYDTRELLNCTGVVSDECQTYPNVPIGQYWNDVWSYNLNCARKADLGCHNEGWTLLDAGDVHGGCKMDFGLELCTHPNERYNHAVAMFTNGLMMVYGGFSQWCSDYCEDVWVFDTKVNLWSKLEDSTPLGKRWSAGTAYAGLKMWLFGGHRLWHGFGPGSSQDNSWEVTTAQFPTGGYLNDLWQVDISDKYYYVMETRLTASGGPVYIRALFDATYVGHTPDIKDEFAHFQFLEVPGKWPWSRTNDLVQIQSTFTKQLLAANLAKNELTTMPEGSEHPSTYFIKEKTERNYFTFRTNITDGDQTVLVNKRFITAYENGFNITSLPVIDKDSYNSKFIMKAYAMLTYTPIPRQKTCGASWSGVGWERRRDVSCVTFWPSVRSGHQVVWYKNALYTFGGYRTSFPYPYSTSSGSASGIGSIVGQSYGPFPSLPAYLQDFWVFNLTTGFWAQIQPLSTHNPLERKDYSMVLADRGWDGSPGAVLILFGGYRSNYFYQDFWMYNISSNRWLKKTTHVHPHFPDTCTNDDQTVDQWDANDVIPEYHDYDCVTTGGNSPEGSRCVFPIVFEGKRYESCITDRDPPRGDKQQNVKIYPETFPWCATDPVTKTDPAIMISNWGYCNCANCKKWDEQFPCCTKDDDVPGIVAPKEQCCPQRVGDICDNDLDLFGCWDDYCYAGEQDRSANMSVWAHPTKGMSDIMGRKHMFVHQPRRQRYGWDGCRDRSDGRLDMENKLLFMQPSQRFNHKSVYSNKHDLMLTFGGQNFKRATARLFDRTEEYEIVGDLWAFSIDTCPSRCSGRGKCFYGYCYCDRGFYGLDCSNTSCPGDFCSYDPYTHKQTCSHCCSASHEHAEGEGYVRGERKVACDANHPGSEHGLCDGFGHCQCQPGMLGPDCSISDCPNRCSGHGECSLEYPVARCFCEPRWFGVACNGQMCLNNCSYPQGDCVNGKCVCRTMRNPYNNTVPWKKYNGVDCSFVTPFASASPLAPGFGTMLLCAGVGAFCAWL